MPTPDDALPHTCHALECKVECDPERLMCKPHWFLVPAPMRAAVLAAYRPGQCQLSPLPSEAWHRAADAAIAAVALAEGRVLPPGLARRTGHVPAGPLDGLWAVAVPGEAATQLLDGRRETLDRDVAPPPPRLGRPIALYDVARRAVVALAWLVGSIGCGEAEDPERLGIVAASEPGVVGPHLWQFEALVPLAPVAARVTGAMGQLDGADLRAILATWPEARDAAFAPHRAHWLAAEAEAAAEPEPEPEPEPEASPPPEPEPEPEAAPVSRVTGGTPTPAPSVPTVTVTAGAPPWPADEFVVLDTETTGRDKAARVVEIAALRVRRWKVVDRYVTLVNPGMNIPADATRVHGIDNTMVRRAPQTAPALARLRAFADGARVIAHNESFDRRILTAEYARVSDDPPRTRWYCSLKMARTILPEPGGHSLSDLVTRFAVPERGAHRAEADTLRLLDVLAAMVRAQKAAGVELRFDTLLQLGDSGKFLG